MEFAKSAARLAAQFSRSGGPSFTVEEIAQDAIRFAKVAQAIKLGLSRQKPVDLKFQQLAPIAARYRAEVVKSGNPEAMSVGLKFMDGSHASGFRNIFFVS